MNDSQILESHNQRDRLDLGHCRRRRLLGSTRRVQTDVPNASVVLLAERLAKLRTWEFAKGRLDLTPGPFGRPQLCNLKNK